VVEDIEMATACTMYDREMRNACLIFLSPKAKI